MKPLEPSSAAAAAVGPNAAMPSASSASTRPGDERRLRPDDDKIDPLAPAERDEAGDVAGGDRHAFGLLGDPGIARRAIEPVDQRRGRDRPGERMLAPARSHHQHPHLVSPPARNPLRSRAERELFASRIALSAVLGYHMAMDDLLTAAPPRANLVEYTVSELSAALKRSIEDGFGFVRVRGEISGFKRHGSGHCYFALKDTEAVLDAVCWRMTAIRLGIKPEDGMEVVCTGRLTTFPGRSKYQLVVDPIELAGIGALLKLLEERRQRLAAEGLFAAERKKPLPFLPEVIGVVTSPTGAVIRDILHRLADRFPRRVLIWPVAVQGEGAAAQVAAAIAGFNRLPCRSACRGPI